MEETMADIGIVLKTTKNADHQEKRFQNALIYQKLWQKHVKHQVQRFLYFEPILSRKCGFQSGVEKIFFGW